MLPTTLGDPFLWGVGIEDTFIGQPSGQGRVLDEYELTQHYRFWREDLARVAGLGVTWMRYGIPWYRVNPEPGVFDWTWTDQVLPYLREELGIMPILDLVHYGCPLWLKGHAANPDYPRRVAEYAGAVAERYGHLVPAYTPLNEPVVNALFCGRNGRWPPYLRGDRGYVRILMALVQGISLTIREIRQRQPSAEIVHVEATGSLGPVRHVDYAAEDSLDQHFLPAELVMGRVSPEHPLRPWLIANGAKGNDLDWLEANRQSFDIIGINFYPTFREARRIPRPHELSSIGREMTAVLGRFADRFDLPIVLTETSDIASGVQRRSRWMQTSVGAVARARELGTNVVGYIWFPVFSCLDWSYRAGRRPADDYLLHMGLWDLWPDGAGQLIRHETELVGAYRRMVAGGAPTNQIVPGSPGATSRPARATAARCQAPSPVRTR
jgi:beta-glucosidase/6-phospho-beta-glucosidase/beta-galactosidase